MLEKEISIPCRERKICSFSSRSQDRRSKGINSTTNAFVIKDEAVLAEVVCRGVGFYCCRKHQKGENEATANTEKKEEHE